MQTVGQGQCRHFACQIQTMVLFPAMKQGLTMGEAKKYLFESGRGLMFFFFFFFIET